MGLIVPYNCTSRCHREIRAFISLVVPVYCLLCLFSFFSLDRSMLLPVDCCDCIVDWDFPVFLASSSLSLPPPPSSSSEANRREVRPRGVADVAVVLGLGVEEGAGFAGPL